MSRQATCSSCRWAHTLLQHLDGAVRTRHVPTIARIRRRTLHTAQSSESVADTSSPALASQTNSADCIDLLRQHRLRSSKPRPDAWSRSLRVALFDVLYSNISDEQIERECRRLGITPARSRAETIALLSQPRHLIIDYPIQQVTSVQDEQTILRELSHVTIRKSALDMPAAEFLSLAQYCARTGFNARIAVSLIGFDRRVHHELSIPLVRNNVFDDFVHRKLPLKYIAKRQQIPMPILFAALLQYCREHVNTQTSEVHQCARQLRLALSKELIDEPEQEFLAYDNALHQIIISTQPDARVTDETVQTVQSSQTSPISQINQTVPSAPDHIVSSVPASNVASLNGAWLQARRERRPIMWISDNADREVGRRPRKVYKWEAHSMSLPILSELYHHVSAIEQEQTRSADHSTSLTQSDIEQCLYLDTNGRVLLLMKHLIQHAPFNIRLLENPNYIFSAEEMIKKMILSGLWNVYYMENQSLEMTNKFIPIDVELLKSPPNDHVNWLAQPFAMSGLPPADNWIVTVRTRNEETQSEYSKLTRMIQQFESPARPTKLTADVLPDVLTSEVSSELGSTTPWTSVPSHADGGVQIVVPSADVPMSANVLTPISTPLDTARQTDVDAQSSNAFRGRWKKKKKLSAPIVGSVRLLGEVPEVVDKLSVANGRIGSGAINMSAYGFDNEWESVIGEFLHRHGVRAVSERWILRHCNTDALSSFAIKTSPDFVLLDDVTFRVRVATPLEQTSVVAPSSSANVNIIIPSDVPCPPTAIDIPLRWIDAKSQYAAFIHRVPNSGIKYAQFWGDGAFAMRYGFCSALIKTLAPRTYAIDGTFINKLVYDDIKQNVTHTLVSQVAPAETDQTVPLVVRDEQKQQHKQQHTLQERTNNTPSDRWEPPTSIRIPTLPTAPRKPTKLHTARKQTINAQTAAA